MCASMVDIQSATAEIRRGKQKDRKKDSRRNHTQGTNIMSGSAKQSGHKSIYIHFVYDSIIVSSLGH